MTKTIKQRISFDIKVIAQDADLVNLGRELQVIREKAIPAMEARVASGEASANDKAWLPFMKHATSGSLEDYIVAALKHSIAKDLKETFGDVFKVSPPKFTDLTNHKE